METNFDLDINNYTTNDLINFFKLENNFSLDDLIKKEFDLVNELLLVNNLIYTPKQKFDIINFIKSGKDVLISFHNELNSINEIKKNINKFLNEDEIILAGKIINPLSEHQTLQHSNIPNDNINGYNYNITTSIYVFNTSARNDFYNTKAVNSTYELPIKWKNVISISLSSATIPNIMYAFNYEEGTNQIYIKEDNTGLSSIITLPIGNYTPYSFTDLSGIITNASFPDILTNCINDQLGIIEPYRFEVTIDLSTRKTSITNNTNTFTMITLNKNQTIIVNDKEIFVGCNVFSSKIGIDYGLNPPKKTSIPVETYLNTMGYLMGFREIIYYGDTSYTSESIFNNTYSNYLYFVLEDYTGSQTITDTYGILGDGILKNNILGVIPINSNIFTSTFDNNANFIYKKREYFGPVDISKISIKLLNQTGKLVNLHDTNFNFTLQVKSIYNLTEKNKMNLRRSDFL